jgi:2-polyprenyl-6-methoxyphenol hydroxylase-like FAD-dependent oxidoreductase
MRYDFTIFGSGISAKITSCLLARDGFKVCLVTDKKQGLEKPPTNLVTFLSVGSLNYLSSQFPDIAFFSKYPEIRAIKCQLNDLNKNRHQSIKFNNESNEILGKIVKNTELEQYLDNKIIKLNNINIINSNPPAHVKNITDGVKLTLKSGEVLLSDLFLLSSSQIDISKQLEISFIEQDLKQQALSISIKANLLHKNCAFQKFTSDGPLALLPYSDKEASIVWSLNSNSEILIKNNEELINSINDHLQKEITSTKIISIEKHNLKFVYAKRLRSKNIVLLGNIAHNIHPIAGQGLNLSIKDIALFLKLMTKYRSIGYRVNNNVVLEEYEINRKLDNAAYSFGTFLLNDILSSNNQLINFTARKGIRLTDKIRPLKRIFTDSATGNKFFRSL